jgi:hypothetical protein
MGNHIEQPVAPSTGTGDGTLPHPAHTPGPWFVFGNGHCVGGRFTPRSDLGDDPTQQTAGVAMCAMKLRPPSENEANAKLIVSAPAADLILRMLQRGVAAFDPSTAELRFNGLRYSARDCDWDKIVAVIGWEKCQRAAYGPREGAG